MKRLAFLASFLAFMGVCAASTDWPNEPAGSTLLTDFPFNAKSGSGWGPQYPGGNIISDPTAPFSGPNVLEEKWENHNYPNIANITYGFPSGTSEFYFGLWWKPSNPFYGWQSNQFQKIMILEGSHTYFHMYRKSGTGASSVYGLCLHPDAGNNNCHIASGISCDLLFPNANNPDVALGQWHRLEYYIRASTNTSSRDGVMRWWMDGVLISNYTTVNTNVQTFSQIQTYHWDMSPDPQVVTDYHRFDHARISRPNCGTSGCSGPVPPTAPTNLVATAKTASQIDLSWKDNSSTESGFEVDRKVSPTGVWSRVGTAAANATSYTVSGLGSNHTFYFRVRAVSALGLPSGYSNEASATTSTSAIAAGKLTVTGSQLTVRPGMGNVLFLIPQGGAYSLSVHDLSGREVWRYAGVGEAIWNHGGNLKKGVYLVRAEQNGKAMNTSYCHVW